MTSPKDGTSTTKRIDRPGVIQRYNPLPDKWVWPPAPGTKPKPLPGEKQK